VATGQYSLLERFASAIKSLPENLPESSVRQPSLLLEQRGPVSIYYAPFDYINESARLVLVGITPGAHQMHVALMQARKDLRAGLPLATAAEHAKYAGSFHGPMRAHLVRMLDGVGVAARLGLSTTGTLFDRDRPLLHTTSALRYPVFVNGRNYSGHSPNTLSEPLVGYIDRYLADDLARVSHALIVPLGDSVGAAVAHLVRRGVLAKARCLLGFPHPSGGNGWRERHFSARRETMQATVNVWFGHPV